MLPGGRAVSWTEGVERAIGTAMVVRTGSSVRSSAAVSVVAFSSSTFGAVRVLVVRRCTRLGRELVCVLAVLLNFRQTKSPGSQSAAAGSGDMNTTLNTTRRLKRSGMQKVSSAEGDRAGG